MGGFVGGATKNWFYCKNKKKLRRGGEKKVKRGIGGNRTRVKKKAQMGFFWARTGEPRRR